MNNLMNTLFAGSKAVAKKAAVTMTTAHLTDAELVAKIHAEVDAAAEKLLGEAKKVLDETKIPETVDQNSVARRLEHLGFKNAKQVRALNAKVLEAEAMKEKWAEAQSKATLISDYQREYPFLKFLTEDQLDHICGKYGLTYAPVSCFLGVVPEKNLREIETAQIIKREHVNVGKTIITVHAFNSSCPPHVQKFLSKPFVLDGKYEQSHFSEYDLAHCLERAGVDMRGVRPSYIATSLTKKVIDQSGLFVCGPPKDFDLSGVGHNTKHGAFEATVQQIQHDPIVFRYCKGGIQVLTKWGPEAEIPELLNPINN